MEVILGKKAGLCYGVENTIIQVETAEVAKQVELMIIIGAKKSNYANKLYEIAIRECSNAMIVETMEDLYLNYISRFKKVGVTAVASAPKEMVKQVVEILKNTQTGDYIYEYSR